MKASTKKLINTIVVLSFSTSLFVYASLFFLIVHDNDPVPVINNNKNSYCRNGKYFQPFWKPPGMDYEEEAINLLKDLTRGLINDEQSNLEKAFILMNFTYNYLNFSKRYVSTNSIYILLLRGEGMCPDFAGLFVALCTIYDISARRMAIFGNGSSPGNAHTISEVVINEDLKIFDPTCNLFLNHSVLEFHNFNMSQRLNITWDSMAKKFACFFRFFESPSIFDSYHCSYSPIYNDGEASNYPINLDLSWY